MAPAIFVRRISLRSGAFHARHLLDFSPFFLELPRRWIKERSLFIFPTGISSLNISNPEIRRIIFNLHLFGIPILSLQSFEGNFEMSDCKSIESIVDLEISR